MRKYLIPRIPLSDLPALLCLCLIGSLIAAIYGLVHDQVTYSIGPEYFTRFKFEQFRWADLGLGDRLFVASIGMLATWWVGFITAWILGRRMLPNHTRPVAYRKVAIGYSTVLLCGLLGGMAGYAYGLWRGPDADYSYWAATLDLYRVTDHWSFLRVGYIHNAGYLGGFVGLILTFFIIRPESESSSTGFQARIQQEAAS